MDDATRLKDMDLKQEVFDVEKNVDILSSAGYSTVKNVTRVNFFTNILV